MHSILQQTTKVIALTIHSSNQLIARLGDLNEICILSARILIGLFFVYFGMDKLMHYSDTTVYMSAMGVPGLFLPLVLLIEIGGGIAVILGWRLRLVAGVLAGFTLLTSLLFHADFAEPVQVILFMKNMALLGGLLLMIAVTALLASQPRSGGKKKSA